MCCRSNVFIVGRETVQVHTTMCHGSASTCCGGRGPHGSLIDELCNLLFLQGETSRRIRNGNFTFTPEAATLLVGSLKGKFFGIGNNVDVSNVQFPLPAAQIPSVTGNLTPSVRTLQYCTVFVLLH